MSLGRLGLASGKLGVLAPPVPGWVPRGYGFQQGIFAQPKFNRIWIAGQGIRYYDALNSSGVSQGGAIANTRASTEYLVDANGNWTSVGNLINARNGLGHNVYEGRTDLFSYSTRVDVAKTLTVTGNSGGWVDGEVVTSNAGGNGALYIADLSTGGTLVLGGNIIGNYANTNVVTGSTSGATATISVASSTFRAPNEITVKGAGSVASPGLGGIGQAILETSNNAEHRLREQIAVATNSTYTWSAIVKPNGRTVTRLRVLSSPTVANGILADFTLSGSGSISNLAAIGAATGAAATIQSYANGWYLVTLTGNVAPASGDTSAIFDIYSMATAGTPSFTGDPTKGLYVALLQSELGGSATPPISTQLNSVARAADVCSMTLPAALQAKMAAAGASLWFDGTLQVPSTYANQCTALTLSNGTNQERVILGGAGGSQVGFGTVTIGGVGTSASTGVTWTQNTEKKLAVAVNTSGRIASILTGGSVVTGAPGSPNFSLMNTLNVMCNQSGAAQYNGLGASWGLAPIAWSDAQLASLV